MYNNIFQNLEEIIEETKGIGDVLNVTQKIDFLNYLNSEVNSYFFNTLNENVYLGNVVSEHDDSVMEGILMIEVFRDNENDYIERGEHRHFGYDTFDMENELKQFVLEEFEFYQVENLHNDPEYIKNHLVNNPEFKANKFLEEHSNVIEINDSKYYHLRKNSNKSNLKGKVLNFKKKETKPNIIISTRYGGIGVNHAKMLGKYASLRFGLDYLIEEASENLIISGNIENPFSRKELYSRAMDFINNTGLNVHAYATFDEKTENFQIYKREAYFGLKTSKGTFNEFLFRKLQKNFIVTGTETVTEGQPNFLISGLEENRVFTNKFGPLWIESGNLEVINKKLRYITDEVKIKIRMDKKNSVNS